MIPLEIVDSQMKDYLPSMHEVQNLIFKIEKSKKRKEKEKEKPLQNNSFFRLFL